MKGIFRFNQDAGRMGHLAGIFVAEAADVLALTGKEIYFGEVLGKYSEITVEMDADNLKPVSFEKADIATFERLKLQTGINPFDYDYAEDDEEED